MQNKILNYKLFFLGIFLFLPSFVLATPSISGINGTLLHDAIVTVSGIGFGIKTQISPNLWDTVENQSAYNGLQDGDIIPVGGINPWGINSEDGWSNDKERYESTDAQRGKSLAMYKSLSNASGYLGDRGVSGSKIYLSWWEKINMDLPVISRKILRISDPDDLIYKTFSWSDQQIYVYIDGCYNENTWGGSPLMANTWHFFETYIDSTAKTLEAWQDGQRLLFNDSWSTCADSNLNSIWKLGYDEPHSFAFPTTWIDDIYLDNTPARIMICSGSVWTNKGACEMQIPEVTWSDNNLQFKVNQGNFTNNTAVYLYITDSTGTANASGFPITFDSGSSDTTAPSAPTGLGIS